MKTFLNKQSKPIVITIWAISLIIILSGKPWQLIAQAPQPTTGVKYAQVASDDLKEWLTYLASDELQGRQVFTEGYGLAAQYIADHLKQWGVKPLNSDGSYFQQVKLKGYRVTRNSSVTVDSNGKQTTFKHGDHVTFSVNSGGKQTVAFNGVEFVGYGQQSDYTGRDVKGKLVLVVPNLAANAGWRRQSWRRKRRRRGIAASGARGADYVRSGFNAKSRRAGIGSGSGRIDASKRSRRAGTAGVAEAAGAVAVSAVVDAVARRQRLPI